MDLSAYSHSETISIDRSPQEVYDLVSDVSKMGNWSPVCTGGEYDDGDRRWFTGHNAIGEFTWDTRCEVVADEPGREFAFVNHGGDGTASLVQWGFRFEAEGSGTKVTQTWQVLPQYADFVRAGKPDAEDAEVRAAIDGMKGMALTGMPETLAKLKAEAEAGGGVSRRHEESVVILRPPAEVWALVADPTAMPRWSPTVTAASWDDEARTSFTGRNEQGGRTWETTCRIEVSEPERELTFLNCGDGSTPIVRWGFLLSPADGGGTTLTQTWEVLPAYEAYVSERNPGIDIAARLDEREASARADMPETLARLKAEAEGGSA